MSSKIVIMNRALGWLGQPPINNPTTPESTSGKAIADIFDPIRRKVISKYYWNFAEVTRDTQYLGASESTYDDDYLYPPDCLKLIRPVTDDGCKIQKWRSAYNTQHQCRVIQVDNNAKATLKIIFNYDQKNLGIWSPGALEVLGLELALAAANSILGKENSMVATLNDLLTEELKDAVGVDFQEQPYAVEEVYEVERARRGLGSYDDEPDGIRVIW